MKVLSGLCDLVNFGVDVETSVDAGIGACLFSAVEAAFVDRPDTCSGVRLDFHYVA